MSGITHHKKIFRRRLLFFAASTLMLVGASALSFWLPMREAHWIISQIEKIEGAEIKIEYQHPRWLLLLDETTFHPWFDRVVEIRIFGAPVDDITLKYIASFPHVHTLRVNVADTSATVINNLSRMQQLKWLTLDGDGNSIPLSWITSLTHLDTLHLKNIIVSDYDWHFISEAGLQIEDVWIDGIPLSSTHGIFLASLPSLTTLSLVNCHSSVEFWNKLSKCSELRHLDLNTLRIDNLSMDAISDITSLESLIIWKEVNLNAIQIQSLDQLYKLRNIEFHDCQLPDDESWSALRNLPLLKDVSITTTNIGDYAAAGLAKCLQIEHLDLFETSLTDEGLQHLKDIVNLKQLNIQYTKVTKQGVEKFQNGKSGVVIYSTIE